MESTRSQENNLLGAFILNSADMDGYYDIVCEAIRRKAPVTAIYNGYPREICIHAMGLKNGKRMALVYQFGGKSSSGPIIPDSKGNWHCMALDELREVKIIDGEWRTHTNYSLEMTCIDEIELAVSPDR